MKSTPLTRYIKIQYKLMIRELSILTGRFFALAAAFNGAGFAAGVVAGFFSSDYVSV